MKPIDNVRIKFTYKMPPTRGHDLKPATNPQGQPPEAMPPTRGHDLKHIPIERIRRSSTDAPHTGARLETPTTERAHIIL